MNDFIRQCKKFFLFAMIFSMVINILQLTFPIYMLQVYDRVLTSYNISTLYVITFAAVIALMTLAFIEWIRSRLLIRAGIEFNKLLSLNILDIELRSFADYKKQGVEADIKDVQVLRNFLSGSAVFAFFDIPWMPIYFLLIFILHPSLGITAMLGGLIVLLLGLLTQKFTSQEIDRANNIFKKSNLLLSCASRSAYAVKSMGMITSVGCRWQKLNDEVIRLQTIASKRAGLLHSINKAFRIGLQVLIYAVGAYLTVTHEATAGVMIAASIIMGRALAPIDQAMATYRQSLGARNSYNKIKSSLKKSINIQNMELPRPTGEILVENATLSIDKKEIFKNLNFHLHPGNILAVIGPSASGKSTLCKALLGIWPLSDGMIRLDGADINLWNSENLGKYLGYLPQEIELFPGTIAENISRLHQVNAQEVIAAAKISGVHDLILGLPRGYDTQIGDFGEGLSGGQKQRIGLARAVYGNPVLIVLDEPNSNLDEEGEQRLLQSLSYLKKLKKTIILVAHKPSVLRVVDDILLLKNGRAIMYGERDEVLRKISGQYNKNLSSIIQNSNIRRQKEMNSNNEDNGYVSP